MVQLLHPYMTTGKTKVLTIQTFVGKVRSLLLITLSTFVSFPSKEQTSFNYYNSLLDIYIIYLIYLSHFIS